MALNAAAYLAANPDVAASGMTAEQHYTQFGQYEGRDPGGATSGAQTHYWDSADWQSQAGDGGGTRATGIKSSSTPVKVAGGLPSNASFYNAPAQFEGRNFNVGLTAQNWSNVQNAVAGGMDFNEAVIRNSGDGIGTRVIMPADSGYLPYGVDVTTGAPTYSTGVPGEPSRGGGGGASGGGSGLVGGAMGGGYGGSASGFTPWNVTPNQTTQGQLGNVLAQDGPLMQQARGGAMQQMNERGLINSSLATQAAQAAVMDRAIQIAQPDAATFARSGEFNAGQQNAWNLAQQELGMKESQFGRELAMRQDQFGQELAFKYNELGKSQDNKIALMEAEAKYNNLMRNDEAFNKQYAMYVEALYQIDKDKDLGPEAKQAAKFQQARMLEDYAQLRGLNLNLDFSSRFAGAAPAPAPQQDVGIINQAGILGWGGDGA
jgi:hypothetical protein